LSPDVKLKAKNALNSISAGAPPDPLAGFKWPTTKGREGKGREMKGRKGRREEGLCSSKNSLKYAVHEYITKDHHRAIQ